MSEKVAYMAFGAVLHSDTLIRTALNLSYIIKDWETHALRYGKAFDRSLDRARATSVPGHGQVIRGLSGAIRDALRYLESLAADSFVGSQNQKIDIPFGPSTMNTTQQYITRFSLPNFYFHVVTGYDILRQTGLLSANETFSDRWRTKAGVSK
jgi:hypothetical protein